MGLPTYPFGIRPNVALAEPRTNMCIPHQGLFKGCNGVRLKVNEKWIKAQDPKNKPPKVCKPLHWNLSRLEISHFSLNLDLNLTRYNLCT